MIFFKGFAMGIADIVPGVSGGTIALITGIYDKLLESISRVDQRFIRLILSFKFKESFDHININFLIPLMVGILLAVGSMAKAMHFLLNNYPIYTWALFFGLISASIIFLLKMVDFKQKLRPLVSLLLGIFLGYAITSLIPVETPDSNLMTFLAGSIGICAMILPGISGSFILLILGKYLFITNALKNPFNFESISIIFIFSLGCLAGLILFSKLLNFLLSKYRNYMMAILTGFMVGSLHKIWPWRVVLKQKVIRGKVKILQDSAILPEILSKEVIFALIIMVIGFIVVLGLEKYSNKK